jgi:hypothetical protein
MDKLKRTDKYIPNRKVEEDDKIDLKEIEGWNGEWIQGA